MSRFVLAVRREAQDEAEEIRAWYEAHSPGLGDRFVDALEACFDEIQENPFLQMRREPFRYATIKGFRFYRVVYVIDQDLITVYQVRHTSRKPHKTYGP